MIITNKYNLPTPIYNAVNQSYAPKEGRLSVTTLIDPPLILHLKKKHWEEMSEDASDLLWRLLGSAMDSILTSNAPKGWPVQTKIELPLDGHIIVGKPDYYNPEDKTLNDWKATSVWQYVFGGKIEWEKQLNLYDFLQRKAGLNWQVEKLIAQRLFRDWTQRRTDDPDYPPIPFLSIELPKWPDTQQDAYIEARLKVFAGEPEPCAPEERWHKPDTYAVMKTGRKSALRVLNSKEEAEQWKADNGGTSIEHRKGEDVRCRDYCPVRDFCPFNIYKKEGVK